MATWKRKGPGRAPTFKSPEEMWEKCCDYFDWVEKNPLPEEKVFCFQGQVTKTVIYKMRAMTKAGLYLHLGVPQRTWHEYTKREAFLDVCEKVSNVIFEQKFTGAAAGLLEQHIVARELGLREQLEHSGPDGGPIQTSSDLEIARRLAYLLERPNYTEPPTCTTH